MSKDKKILIVDRDGKIQSSAVSQKKESNKEDFNSLQYLNLGIYLVLPLLLGVFFGTLVDSWLHTKPFFIILFIILGAISSFYNLIRLTKDASH